MTDDSINQNEQLEHNEALFLQLVVSFQTAAWQQMGKIASFITGKVERDLEMAKNSIDMLGMLEEKTRGNLSEQEKKFIEHTLYELRMNYLEELNKGPDKPEVKAESKGDVADGGQEKMT